MLPPYEDLVSRKLTAWKQTQALCLKGVEMVTCPIPDIPTGDDEWTCRFNTATQLFAGDSATVQISGPRKSCKENNNAHLLGRI
jgi:hypothetical protein